MNNAILLFFFGFIAGRVCAHGVDRLCRRRDNSWRLVPLLRATTERRLDVPAKRSQALLIRLAQERIAVSEDADLIFVAAWPQYWN